MNVGTDMTTYKQQVKAYLKQHGSITVREAETVLEINSPSRPIGLAVAELEREGVRVKKLPRHNLNTGKDYALWKLIELH